ncbi:hypothetical protein FS842_004878 [Serendipita sp. 407]|nr:hypothetical protein FS842_004878 [Serendipita sp. 407]
MTTDHHYHYIENGLQALVRGGTRWADEVANLLFGYLRMKRRKGKLDIVREHLFAVDVLFTVAYLGSRDVEKEEVGGSTMVGIYNGRSSLITALDALSSLSSAMDTPSSAFLISSGIGSFILPILGKWLEREETEELVYKVSQIGDKTLRWYAYQFLGWEYDDILPGPQDDPYWESPAWHQALFQWSMLPLRSRYSDNTILETLAHRANREHDLIILNYFSTRLSEQKLEETEYRKDNIPACLQLLSAALSVFPLVPHLTVSTLGFMNRITDFQSGMRHFIDYGGLDWLAGLPQEVRSAESKHDHEEGEEGDDKTGATKAFTTTDPFYVLLTWFDRGYLDSLDDQYLSTILHSPLVSTYADDREPKWFLGFVVRAVNQLSNPPNASATSGKPLVVFTEASDCCTRILNHQISQYDSSSSAATLQESAKLPLLPPAGGPSWSVPAYGDIFIQVDFQAWQLFVRGLIRTLHGEKGLSYPSTPYE